VDEEVKSFLLSREAVNPIASLAKAIAAEMAGCLAQQ
jgi:hypothetical protein